MPRLALLLTLLLVALAGCGDDDSASDPPPLRDPGAGETSTSGERAGGGEADENSADDLLAGPAGEDEQVPEPEDEQPEREDPGAPEPEGPEAEEPERERDGREREADRDDLSRRGGRPARGDAVTEIRRAQGSLRGLVAGIARGDANVCRRFMTQRYVERITGQRGAAAQRKCRRDVASARIDTELEVFGPAEIKDDRAVIRARVRIADRHFPQVYDMRRGADGRWRVYARLS